MIISLTGTPGTGKTTVAKELSEDFEVIHLTEFLEKHDIGEKVDGEIEVPVQEMKTRLESRDFEENTLIEGHLAHHIRSDICVVLRCGPDELEKRLSSRGYSEEKVEENVESEALDVVLSEAVQEQETIIEIGTTGKTVQETIEQIKRKIEMGESDYGNIDWTEYL